MASPVVESIHAFDAAAEAGRDPFKVADVRLAEHGRKRDTARRAGDAGADGRPPRARRTVAAGRRAGHGQPAHDGADGGAHRDPHRPRRRRALGLVQHFLDPGPRRRRRRRRPAGKRRHARASARRARLRLEGRDPAGVLVVHERGAGLAGRPRPGPRRRRRRRRDAPDPQGLRVRAGRRHPGVRPAERPRGVGRPSSTCCARSPAAIRRSGAASAPPSAASARRRPPASTASTR